jgi:hypothetical protein
LKSGAYTPAQIRIASDDAIARLPVGGMIDFIGISLQACRQIYLLSTAGRSVLDPQIKTTAILQAVIEF